MSKKDLYNIESVSNTKIQTIPEIAQDVPFIMIISAGICHLFPRLFLTKNAGLNLCQSHKNNPYSLVVKKTQ